jgi:cyclophilin family peptidyl-prolyl cis-trans isomerase
VTVHGHPLTTLVRVVALGATVIVVSARQPDRTTPMFVCGANQSIPQPIPLTAAAVTLAADGRLYSPCPQASPAASDRAAREWDLLMRASQSRDADIRRPAAQGFGRIPATSATLTNPLAAMVAREDDLLVQAEAINAIGEMLSGQRGDLAGPALAPQDAAAAVLAAADVLHQQLLRETDDPIVAAMLTTLGRLRYADDAARAIAESRLMPFAGDRPVRRAGAMKGLEALVRQSPRRPLAETTRARLQEIVAGGPTGITAAMEPGAERDDPPALMTRARRLALMALLAAGGDEAATIARAARDADWQVRRLAALRMDWARADLQPAAAALLDDPVFQVRYEILTAFAREIGRTGTCAPLVDRLSDPSPTVVLRVLDLIPAPCRDAGAVVARLRPLADALSTGATSTRWHVPARALAALARVRPDDARMRLSVAAAHQVWQVRAAAAAVAGQLADEPVALRLAQDPVPNVRNAALEALARMRSAGLPAAAISALQSPDYQLVRTAATVLRAVAGEHRSGVSDALLASLSRLTTPASDTSRDPRVAIIERLGELLPAASVSRLTPWLADFDPKVRAAAAAAMRGLTGTEPATPAGIQRRYPVQPAAAELSRLPAIATIAMAGGGRIELELLGAEAPVTVARFAELARAGYYNGLTFHRVAPNFVVQGGSPGAHEYAGLHRYWRDEVGREPNLRGTVGVSTRGRDTGDGQIFINLIDSPRLDHLYTVFARVRAGLDVVDRILEGATIERVEVR